MTTDIRKGGHSLPRRPASSPQIRENQMVDLAVDLAEKQLLDGTASASVITHYLKLATAREHLEREKLANENELLRIKAENAKSAKRMEIVYEEALQAMRAYSGE